MQTHAIEETNEIRTLAREFAAAELRPHVEHWDRDRELPADVFAQIAELGFFGMRVPEAHGGMEFGVASYVAALEELAWGEPSVAVAIAASSFAAELIVAHGDDAQKTRWLEALAAGATLGCFALTEEGAAEDDAAIRTRATRAGDGWELTGEKTWVSNARAAGVAIVLARTGGGDAAPESALFLVPLDSDGVELGERENTMGLRPLEIRSLRLRGVRLGSDALLGAPGAGAQLSADALRTGRLAVAAIAVGIARAALEHAVAYADQREQFGRRIREFEAIRVKLADMATRTAAARALLAQAAAENRANVAAMAKLFASEAAMWVTTQAVQVFGGYGYMRDYPVEKLMRDAKATELLEGSSDALRFEIADSLYHQG